MTVAIVGGGLAGLYAGKLLHDRGVDFKVIEARARLGGRILTTDAWGAGADDGFDLGPSWFWPEMQPKMAALVRELGLEAFPQNTDGDVIFQRMLEERPLRYPMGHEEPRSMRLVGGTNALIRALQRQLPRETIVAGQAVRAMVLGPMTVTLKLTGDGGSEDEMEAEQVIAALPPRLLARMSLLPAVDPMTERHWRETATWMAPHAKFLAVYDRPFWRDAGLSGAAQSLVGPMGEVHDASTASGKAALFGFLRIAADMRASLGEAVVTRACLEQLSGMFGAEALRPRATLLKDWAADAWTATVDDRSASGHPAASRRPWVTGAWAERLSLGGSETSATEPGYLAGAVSAAERAVAEVVQRLPGSGARV